MNVEKNLEKYAELIVKKGINVQPGDKLMLRGVGEEGLPLARKIVEKAYKMGAKDVQLLFSDDDMILSRYLYAPDEAFKTFEEYHVDYMEALFKDDYHVIFITAPNPDLLKDASPQRIAEWAKVSGTATKRIMKYTLENMVKWNISAVAGKAWAKAVFPELSEEEGIEKLWEKIFDATRVRLEDPVAAWDQHDQELKYHEKYLNDANFEKLLYRGEGTDLEVYLVENHRWMGGSSKSSGVSFFPNMPTEEVFSMPHADKVNGTLRATLPLSVRGQIVDKFHFTFRDGLVVDFDAEVGKEILKDLLEMDEGAKRLGEVALVAHNSPISNTGVLFKNTLFDENASCHFAVGAAYGENIEGFAERSQEENRKLGVNDSLIHVDFMVGDENLEVIGVKHDGTQVTLLKDGNWVI